MYDPFAQSGPQLADAQLKQSYFAILGGNIVPSIKGTNVSYAFGIKAYSLLTAKSLRDQVLLGGIGSSTDVNVAMWSESSTEFSRQGVPVGVRTKLAVVGDRFYTYDLTVNGVQQADLTTGNVLHYDAGHGWDVVETCVPLSAFGTSAPYDNQAEITWTTRNSFRVWYATQRVQD